MGTSTVKHTSIRNGNLFCTHCGGEFRLVMPIPVEDMTAKIESFNTLHANCLKTWKEPIIQEGKSVQERAQWWLLNGERGTSSKTIYGRMVAIPIQGEDHPYDPDDFSRCYKLLKLIPEWRTTLHVMKDVSLAWSNLVDNWDKLTDMYEENVRTEWKKSKEIGMFKFMQTLICDSEGQSLKWQ